MHRTIELELGAQRLTLSMAKPPRLRTVQEFIVAHWSHVLAQRNSGSLNRDEVSEIGRLGSLGAFVQAALVDNPFCLWQGDDATSRPFVDRQAVGASVFFRVLRGGGVASVKKIVDAFLSLFPAEST